MPTNLPSGMILWLANNAGVVMNGSSVSQWDDLSGSGNNASQSQGASQPTIVSGNNGQKALHFDGKADFLSVSNLPIDGLSGLTVYMVSASTVDSTDSSCMSAFLYWPETAWWGATYFGPFQTNSRFRFGTTQISNDASYNFALSRTKSFGLSEWQHNGTSESMWFNGQSIANFSGKQSSLAGIGNVALLGQGYNNSYFTGDVSEVIVYQRALSATERRVVESYLMSKYHL